MLSRKNKLKRILDKLEPPSELKKSLRRFKNKIDVVAKEQDKSLYRLISPFVERVRSVDINNREVSSKINELYAKIDELRSKPGFDPSSIYDAISAVEDSIISFQENIETYATTDELLEEIAALKEEISKNRSELMSRGGSMNRQILINGVNYLTRYTDINLIGTITATNNNTLKRVDINITTSSGLNIEQPTGTINGSNTVFTVTNTPKYIIVDGLAKFETLHYTYSAGTITITDGVPPWGYIKSLY